MTDPRGSDLGAFAAERGDALLRFAFLLTGGDAHTAEDLVQSVLARLAVRGIGDLHDPEAYARRAVVNEQRSLFRRRGTQRRVLDVLDAGDPQTPPAAVEDRLAMLDALRCLSRRERAAVVLRYYLDLPDTEIAEMLGCSRPTVRSLVHRALPKLRERLGEDEPTKEPDDA